MCYANEVASEVFHQLNVASVSIVIEGHSHWPLVLMTVGSAEFIWFAVEHESFLCIKCEEAQTDFGCLWVKHIACLVINDGSGNLVKTGWLWRPKLRICYLARFICCGKSLPCFQFYLLVVALQEFSLGGKNVIAHNQFWLLVGIVAYFHLHLKRCVLFVNIGRWNKYAFRSIVVERNVLLGSGYEPYVTIYTSPEGEVCP